MTHIKKFNESSETPAKFGYYDMANAYMPGLIEDLKNLKEQAGNYVSFSYNYDEYSNFCEIEAMSGEWMDKIIEAIERNDGYYEGWENELTDDALVIKPMKFYS